MGILDKFRFRKGQPEKQERPVVDPEAKPDVAAIKPVSKKPKLGLTSNAHEVLVRPILSEKAIGLAASGKYVFAVSTRANKSEIKKSIQKVYDVHVIGVNISNLPGKKRRSGRTQGRTAAWKKAVVKLAAGEKISGIVESVG